MARKIFQIIIILLFCAACTSRHEEMLQRLDELDAMGNRYEAMPNDTVAMDVVAHMERCGTLAERERAWKMMAKVYRRRGWNFYEESAWSMAVGCVDTTQAFDTLALAQTLFDWSHCLDRSLDDDQSREQLNRAVRYAMMAGDTLRAMLYYGDINSDSAYHYLWSRGERQLAMDASMGMIEGMTSQHWHDKESVALDSVAMLLDRYAHYTSYNIESPYSYEANRYWMAKGELFKTREQYDSAIHYFHRVADMDSLRWEAASFATHKIAECYDAMGMKDSSDHYWSKNIQLVELLAHGIVGDRFKSRFHDYQIQHDNLEMRDEAERQHLWMLGTGLLFLFVASFGLYRHHVLRHEHRESLQRNQEYAELLRTLREKKNGNTLLDQPIAQHLHQLSSQDKHPSDEEWAELKRGILQHYPHIYERLSAEHTLTEQEQRILSLLIIKCTPLQMSVLLVCTKSNISNLRRRLYKRITGKDGCGTDLDELVNGLCR